MSSTLSTDVQPAESEQAAKRAFTEFGGGSSVEFSVEDTSFYVLDDVACDLPLSKTLPKPSRDNMTAGTVAPTRPLHLNLPQNMPVISLRREVSESSSTSSALLSGSGSSLSEDDSEFPLTPQDESYSPISESVIVYDPEASHENAELYFEPQIPSFRRLVDYNMSKTLVTTRKTYLRSHKHHVSENLPMSIPSWLSNTIGYRPRNLKQPYTEVLRLMKKFWNQPQGRRKALCIGIDYKGQIGDALKGCVNDAHRMRDFLIDHGRYKAENITTLSDGGGGEPLPTKENIITSMRELVDGAKEDDILFFHSLPTFEYWRSHFLVDSGHGIQVTDQNGDEDDGFDEVLVPADYKTSGYIVDDDLNEILVKNLPKGCHLTALIDACHSGTILDLPYNVYHCEGPTDGLDLCSRKPVDIIASVVSWSGCTDAQLSEEVIEAKGLYGGLMTDAFLSCLTSKPRQTFQELYDNLMEKINLKHPQKPQLGVSREIDATHFFVY